MVQGMQYNDIREITITDLVENMWLTRYSWLIKITYDQGSEFISHEFRKFLIEKLYMGCYPSQAHQGIQLPML